MSELNAGALIELFGNKSANIDGCCGVISYSDDEIVLKSGRQLVKFSGRNLRLKQLGESFAVVVGYIKSVEFGK